MLRSLHSRAFALGILVPFSLFAIAACGGSGDSASKPAGDTVATTPPVVAQPGTTVATGVVVPTTVTYAQADSVFRTRDYASAATMFAAYTQRRPDNPWGHYMLGLSDWKSGQLDSARAAFEDALKLDPKHVKSMINLARVLLDEDSAAAALPRVQQAIALDSGSTDAWRVLGRVQAQVVGVAEGFRSLPRRANRHGRRVGRHDIDRDELEPRAVHAGLQPRGHELIGDVRGGEPAAAGGGGASFEQVRRQETEVPIDPGRGHVRGASGRCLCGRTRERDQQQREAEGRYATHGPESNGRVSCASCGRWRDRRCQVPDIQRAAGRKHDRRIAGRSARAGGTARCDDRRADRRAGRAGGVLHRACGARRRVTSRHRVRSAHVVIGAGPPALAAPEWDSQYQSGGAPGRRPDGSPLNQSEE